MIALETRDKELLNKFFNTSGYVFDFSTIRFDEFTYESIGLALVQKYKASKGQSLRQFIYNGELTKVIKLCNDLLDYYDDYKTSFREEFVKEEYYTKCKNLLTGFSYLRNEANKKERIIYQDEKEYDVFISHATADKETYVEQLVDEIKKTGAKVWYDKDMIGWGDSLTKKIDSGLEKSEFGIIILSNNFFDRGWCERELKKLFDRHLKEKSKLLLPIIYNCEINKVVERYPFLEDVYMLSNETYSEKDVALLFAKELIQRLRR